MTTSTPDKRRLLLDRLLRRQGAAASVRPLPGIPRRRGQGPVPLSFAQQRLWFLDRLEPGSSWYNLGAALLLQGALAVSVLARCLAEIVRRHEVLRTTFPAPNGEPEQRIAPASPRSLALVDLTGLPAGRREAELDAQVAAVVRGPFDLARGPLLRTVLLQRRPGEHVLALAVHHIAADAGSIGIFVRELQALYAAWLAGGASPLPELPVQYADFAAWQRRRLTRQALAPLLAAWRARLAGMPPALELPTDRPRPAVQTYRGRSLPVRLDEPAVAALRAAARAEGCTLFMALLACFQALLFRHTGQRDLAVGTPVSGRTAVELEGAIGAYINILVLRGTVREEMTLRELLAQARQVVLDAHGLGELPFEMLVDELQPVRDLVRSPLFQVMLVLHGAAAEPLALPGVTLTPLPVDGGTAKFDLLLSLAEGPRGATGWLESNSDLFDKPTVQRLLGHFQALVAAAGNGDGRGIADLPLLTAAERHQLLEWNDTAAEHPLHDCLHELFAAQARRTPEAPAVVWQGLTLTYRELDRRSGALAARLRRLGVAAEVRVGICLPREPELIVALLATLRAGGAYVPLDPAYPRQRLRFLVADAGVRVLVTRPDLAGAAGSGSEPDGPEVVLLAPTGDGPAGNQLPAAAELAADLAPGPDLPPAGTVPANLAYVIYTSGSTGRPKGVAIAHRSAVALIHWARREFAAGELAGMLAATSICFDLSVFEIFAPLCWGGRVVLVEDALELAALPPAADVRLVNTVPSAMAELVRLGGVPDSVRTVALAGEPLKAGLVEAIGQQTAARRILNLYGPSEDTTYSTCSTCSSGGPHQPADRRPPTIGRPLANTQAHLLGAGLRAVPLGAAGELCLGGEGLARGYLGRPELTAERFVPDPFAAAPGSRLYRTGDLARQLPDGRLDFLGRADHQVKLRGYRIELGEIEAALEADPRIREAVVVLRDRGADEATGQLVAYVAGPEPLPESAALCAALAARLPGYMVPRLFVPMPALPRTPNGKVDRAALPSPAGPAGVPGPGHVAPRNELEARLAEIWRERLRLERIGVHDDFFGLGGDSILSIQVVARAARAGIHLTPKQFFAHPTIAGLAAVAAALPRPEIAAGGSAAAGPVPLTPIQLWFFAQEPPHPAHFNQAVLLRLRRPLAPAALFAACSELLRHHDALRCRFLPPAAAGEAWTAAVEPAPAAALGCAGLIDLAGLPRARQRSAQEAAAAMLQRGFDLASGRLLRAVLFGRGHGGAQDRLLLIVHHLAVDGVSWRVLIEDLEQLCRQAEAGQPPALPPPNASFQRWARSLAARAAAAAGEEAGWLAQLAGPFAPLRADLPGEPGVPGGGGLVGEAASLSTELEATATRALLREVPRAYRTRIHEVLAAALAESLAEATGGRRVRFDLEAHGRDPGSEHLDLSRTVGWFTAIVPVVLDLDGAGSQDDPGRLLRAVKEQLRAIPDGGLGHGLLRYLGPAETRRRLDRLPRPEVVLNYLGQIGDGAAAGGPPEALFTAPPAGEGTGAWRHSLQRRAYAVEINGGVAGGKLRLVWTYDRGRHRRAAVERLAAAFTAALRRLIAHCLEPAAGAWTPADFPLARLEQAALDRLALGGEVEDLLPLSPLQDGMLLHSLREPGSGVYVEQVQLWLRGEIDATVLAASCRDLADRHPILRTVFVWAGLERPLQVVRRAAGPELQAHDLRRRPAAARRAALAEHLAADRRRGFDLAAAPAQRLALFHLESERHCLVWSCHHILVDGWSLPLLFRDLFTLYHARLAGTAAQLPPARPYRDYIAWLERRDVAAAEDFWRRLLAGFTAPTALAVDHPPAPLAAGVSLQAELRCHLSAAATGALQAFTRRHRLTLNTLVLGGWALLLRRYGGEEDVVFGVVTSGRSIPLPGVDSIAGLFINTLPIRLAAPADAAVAGWLRQVQDRQAELMQHEASPLAQVQGWSEVRGRPLFDSILAFENYPVSEAARDLPAGRFTVEAAEAIEQTSYPLAAAIGPGERLQVRLLFDPRRFERADVARMAGHLTRLFEELAADAERHLGAVPLLSAAERHQALEGNDTDAPRAGEVCLHDLFTAAAARWPRRIAVIAADGEMTYGELERRSASLAAYLRRRGVGEGVPVGLCTERSLAMVVGLYGILRAGGAYVPLDPTYPAARLGAMLDGVPLLLASRGAGLAEDLGGDGRGAQPGLRTVWLDADWDEIAAAGPTAPAAGVSAASLAYVIYTSGSTGEPKGVMIDHRGAVNTLLDVNRRFAVGPQDRVLALSSLSFDLSVYDVFGLLAAGGAVVLAPSSARRDPRAWVELATRHRVTLWNSVPALVEMLVDYLAGQAVPAPPDLRLVMMSGDWIPVALPDRLRTLAAGVEIIGMGGATEASIWSILYPIRDVAPASLSLPYGRPMANQSFWVLDAALQPQPVGVPGMLFIGGIGVALGYRGDDEKTRASFVRHPATGERLYRTGDLGRTLRDGAIELLGRADHQVKIRGFRIELGDIEAQLARHAQVAEAVAVVREDQPGTRQIAAWVVPAAAAATASPAGPQAPPGSERPDAEGLAAELVAALSRSLPEYMVPAWIGLLDRLPLTANGKVDRAALQRLPPPATAVTAATAAATATPLEELLTGIFAEVLHLAAVGVHDSFFALGGHSLLATQVAFRIRAVAGVELPLGAIFESPTASELAREVERLLRAGSPALPDIQPAPRTAPLPLSFAQERLWFLDRLGVGREAYTIAMAVRLRGPLAPAVLAAGFAEIERRHEALRTHFAATPDGGAVQVVEPIDRALFRLPLVDLGALPATRRESTLLLLAGELRRPFDLEAGPLWRVTLLRLDAGEHAVILDLHHSVADGWSMSLLLRELGTLYGALRSGRPPVLPALPVQYADYAVWQRQRLTAEALASGLRFWRRRLSGLPPRLQLPADRPRPVVRTAAGALRPLRWTPESADSLRRTARQQGVTLFMLLLAGLEALLASVSGEEDLAVGSPVAGRDRAEVESLIGLFSNTLVFRADLAGDPGFSQLLARVRRTALDAYRHQEVPFDKLVEALAPERNLSHTPLFQVLFVFDHAPAAAQLGELAELTAAPLRLAGNTAKFDLNLWLAEAAGGLAGGLEYSTDLFDAATVDRWGRCLETLLAAATAAPSRRLSELPVLAAVERHQLLYEWGPGGAAAAAEVCLHQLFETQAAATPGAVAVVAAAGESLTYGELDEWADRIALDLRRAGAVTDLPVGLCAERSLAMVAGILGILKAGAAYLPLEPSYPAERLALLLRDAGAGLLLAGGAAATALAAAGPLLDDIRRLPLAALPSRRQGPAGAARPAAAAPESLAYVIYTSGSTGRPKGVMVSHRAIANRVLWMKATYPLGPHDAVLQKTPFIFDASIWELFLPLACGARLIMAAPGAHQDPAALVRAIADHRVSVLQLVPSMVGAFLDDPGIADCGSLHRLFCGGESLSPALRDRVFATLPVELCNLYGPTECSIDVTSWPCRREDRRPLVPIGRPLTGIRLHLLDHARQPVPIGAPGELLAGGLGLARGYLGQPEVTAERFIPDPFAAAGTSGSRLYRTGDLVRYLVDGSLDYLGRIDQQVKVRGFRIEPAEIEAALCLHPAVREAAVGVLGKHGGGGRLVAWISCSSAAPDAGELRRFLARWLPDPMIPAGFVTLAALPRTPSGKVDRKALPALAATPRADRRDGPRTPVEELLAGIWAEVLGLARRGEQAGIHDNFFELGGDSILALQVVASAARAGCHVTPRQLFEHQTVARLAAAAGAELPAGAEQREVAGPQPLTPIQGWFFALDDAEPHHFNQSLLLRVAERAAGGAGAAVTRRAFTLLLAHHDALRQRFRPREAGWEAWTAPLSAAAGAGAGELPWLRIDLTRLDATQGRRALALGAAAVQGSLELSRGPLVRAVWLDLPGGAARLLLVAHHLVVDAVSWRLLHEDLETACHQLAREGRAALPPKTTSFRRWAGELAAHAAALPIAPELSWWLGELAPGAVEIPVDDPGGSDLESTARWVGVALDEDETVSLLHSVAAAYHTRIDDLLLTALALTFVGSGGAMLVELEGHGRVELATALDLSRTVGWFTVLYPVRLAVAPGAGPGDALRAIKEHLRAVPGAGLGYGLLRWLRGSDPAAEPLRQARLPLLAWNYLGQLGQPGQPRLPGQLDAAPAEPAWFTPAPEPAGPMRGPRRRRTHSLMVNSWVADGRLRLEWGYGEGRHRRATVEGFANRYLASLRQLIHHCLAALDAGAARWTPADFPLAALDQRRLDRLAGATPGIEDLYPLTPSQEGILFHRLLAGRSELYVEQLLCRLAGDVDAEAFAAAWRRLFARHPVLRTAVVWQGLERPLQVVHARGEAEERMEDWRTLPAAQRAPRLDALVRADAARGFELSQPPLARWALLRTDDREHWFLFTHHHILLDGWSFSQLMGDFLSCYAALRDGAEPVLPHRPAFREHVAWLAGRDPAAAENYWRRTLAGFAAPTPLGLDRRSPPRPPAPGCGDASPWFSRASRLSPAQTAALRATARRHQLTLNTLVQAAWGILLARYAAQEDVVFGVTLAGRALGVADAGAILGLCINTLPVRVDVAGDPVAAPWLRELQLRHSELLQHEQTPLVAVQGCCEVPRGVPLFESLLVFESYPVSQSLQTGDRGLGIAEVRVYERTNYPLTLMVAPGEELLVRADVSRARFDETGARRLVGHLETLLAALAEDRPGARLSDLPALPEAERHQLAVEWAGPGGGAAPAACLHELFMARAAAAPAAVAAVCEDAALTYGELDRRSNRLARHLRRLGVAPEVRVGLCLERSLDMVVAILGVLKAGGAYLPLDPADPPDRLRFMLDDALPGVQPRLLVTRQGLPGGLAGGAELPAGLEVVRLDAGAAALAAESDAALAPAALPDNLAYVIYTSGSTGQPKGAPITHRNVTRLFAATREDFGFDAADTWSLFHSYAFDFSVWELWGALLHGGRAVVVPYWTSRAPRELWRLLSRQRVTVLSQTPSAFRQLAEAEAGLTPAADPPPLRLVVFGGEALDPAAFGGWFGRHGDRRPLLINMYGITETTVHVTARSLGAADAGTPGRSPIGRPLADLRAVLLDHRLRLAPVGVAAEIHVGGPGLSRGYLGRPALTAERFVPDPFSPRPGERLYRTGDLARWTPQGELEFLGRLDHQVKIRGFRIELGEVEAALRTCAGAVEAVAGVHQAPAGAELHAWVAVAPGAAVTAGALRAALATRLPAHMIPASFTLLPALPLTANGKLDRRALPPPERARPPERAFVAPRTPSEQGVARIWAEVLGLERVGVEDDFFALGGHSLAATRIASRIAAELFVELPLSEILSRPTVAAAAVWIDDSTLGSAEAEELQAMLDLMEGAAEAVAEGVMSPEEIVP